MKRFFQIAYIAGFAFLLAACKKEDAPVKTNAKPEVKFTYSQITSDLTLSSDTIYLLHDDLNVSNNATLTIEPGTIIKTTYQNAYLSVQRGSKLVAEGTADHPIIFTSADSAGLRHHGSWVGIFIYGKAPLTNFSDETYDFSGEMEAPGQRGSYGTHESNWGGGDDPADNSGILKYVRIEFGSRSTVAALNLIGVGTGTVLENVEVSYTSGAAFAFWGGTVNARNLVAFNTYYSGFLYTNGYVGKQQFLLSYKHPWFAATDFTYFYPYAIDGLLTVNDLKDYPTAYNTRPVISNLTVIGPYDNPGLNKNRSWNAAVNVSKGSAIALRNSVLMGMPAGGFKLGDNAAAQNFINGTIDVSYNLAHSNVSTDAFTVDPNYVYSVDAATVAQYAADHHNTIFATPDAIMLTDPFNFKTPGVMPKQGSPALSGANFDGSDFSGYFQPVHYAGAFGNTDWMAGWTNFYPITTAY